MKIVVLVGGGHAHLHSLSQFAKKPREDVQLVLISPAVHQYYSGMFSGFTEGVYGLDEIRIDLKQLAQKIGAAFYQDTICAIDANSRTLIGQHGETYPYDAVSFDIGSQTDSPEAIRNYISPIKPNYHFPDQLIKFRKSAKPVIVGGGASGVELAFSTHAWRMRRHLSDALLFSSGALLSAQGAAVSRKIEAVARKKALPFFTDVTIEDIDATSVTTSTGTSYPQSDVLWLTGPKSPSLFEQSGMPVDRSGFLAVHETLQSLRYPEVFGAGDCVSIDRYPDLAKNGVYAVRQGPVLWENLLKFLDRNPLSFFVPQKRYIAILSTGGGEALLTYGNWSVHGKIPWKLKQYIDKKFMKAYQAIYK
ncbi:FAD-dependent oxidoreductase [Planococcus sp. CP5-4]|uniref:FAD-dependent oxidoreductase n=1 Tax=unclassified Planococcus (in: firmicutes) TaxID=2662419 RepID=UPI001C224F8C|nr:MULTISPECIES: FAD-dependent oxidoreductase [unclassified Planococcus (in: firmicutes)]MBU9674333.1 FAD-dependent oxidoreductase [Planococcus sp. CP5-4_YE]MBV0909080.1 FAD-dependent oxidoreductase [Planococcus sp. CP5-4_UN]MBW6065024.1 FAD-dependent oxidoreductase [Planococcus sp. CP5-4]